MVVVNVFAALGENVIVTQKFISLLKQISKAYFEILDLTKTVTCSKVHDYVNNNPYFGTYPTVNVI